MMRTAVRARMWVTVGAVAAVTMVGLTGCGRLGDGQEPAASSAEQIEMTEVSWEGQALEAIGFSVDDMAPLAAPASTAAADNAQNRPGRHKRLRFAFGHRMLHGEGVIQTDEGTKTVVVQRGTVTDVTATSITVKSTDGFTLTWTFGSKLRVIIAREKAEVGALKVGDRVGIAGAKEGESPMARLIVVPKTK